MREFPRVFINPWFWPLFWFGVIFPVLLLGGLYHQSIGYMMKIWVQDENYGHAFFVPLISLFLIWERRHALRALELRGSWWGLPVVFAGIGLYFVGEFSTLYVVLHLSLWIVVMGLLLTAVGPRGVREMAFPLIFLLTMIPLPDFLYQGLSGRLQLISSVLGVEFLQAAGITAFREGNVIDLGPIQLQVAEACNGLRYLFPLATLSLLCAYLFRGRFWMRGLIFLSSLPIAVGLNGFRIGMTGVLVDFSGRGPAEGFFHGFSGWFVFVTGMALLLGEVWVLGRFAAGGKRRSFGEIFGVSRGRGDLSGKRRETALRPSPARSTAYLCSLAFLVPALAASMTLGDREETPPPHGTFADFPLTIGGWEGRSSAMEPVYLETLRFDDYLLADYRTAGGPPVNFYVAYYRSQKKGGSAHSPRTCIPGGGWEITSLRDTEIRDVAPGEEPMRVKRVVIQKGGEKQLVFYWFQQRGRILTSEYSVKYYLLRDALMKNRTDGALVRLAASVRPGESESAAEERLAAFTKIVHPLLARFIPGP